MVDNEEGIENTGRRSFLDKINALSCIRLLVIADIVLQAIKIIISTIILFLTRHEYEDSYLKIFLIGYILICGAKGITFFSKNRSFFRIERIPEYEDNNDISVISNLVEGCSLFWYILGFHWIQQCNNCKVLHPLLYYTTLTWLILGFLTFIAPLLAIVLLLVLVTYIKPKLQTIIYRSDTDIPDGNNSCVICYESYRTGCQVKFLPCDHHFHSECIDEWFHVRDSCPLCKKSINILYDLIENTDNSV